MKSRTRAARGEPMACGSAAITRSRSMARADENSAAGADAGAGRGASHGVTASTTTSTTTPMMRPADR